MAKAHRRQRLMTEIRITLSAREKINALGASEARAVDSAIASIDERRGRPINLPGAPAGTSYLALPTRGDPVGPVIIYRPLLPNEGEGWLVVSLLSPEEYRDLGRAEDLVAASPAAREIVDAVVSGTVGTVTVTADPGTVTVTTPGGAAPTTGTAKH